MNVAHDAEPFVASDLTELFREAGPLFLVNDVKAGGSVFGIMISHGESVTEQDIREARSYARRIGMPELCYLRTGYAVWHGASPGPWGEFFPPEQQKNIEFKTGAAAMSNTIQVVIFVSGPTTLAANWTASLRMELDKILKRKRHTREVN